VSPLAVERRDPNELHHIVHESFENVSESMAADVCPDCVGPVSTTVRLCGHHHLDDGLCPNCDRWSGVAVDLECDVCGRGSVCHPLFASLDHPAVAEATRQSGATNAWERIGWFHDWTVEAVDAPGEPPVRFTSPDDRVAFRVDSTLDVTLERGPTGL